MLIFLKYRHLGLLIGFFAFLLLFVISLFTIPSQAYAESSPNNVKVQTVPGPSVAEKLGSRAKQSWPWYVTRASGFVAAGALFILLLSGVGLVTGYTFKFLEPLTAWASHRALGLVFGGAVFIHVFSLLFDHFVSFNIFQILFPFVSDYRQTSIGGVHVGSIYVAMGIVAFYGVIMIIITSLLWVEKKPHIWKLIHFLSYLVIFDVFLHALNLGTDLAHGIFHWLWIISGVAVALAVLHRLRTARTI